MTHRLALPLERPQIQGLFNRVAENVKNKPVFSWTPELIEEEVRQSYFFVAVDGEGLIQAFVSFRLAEGEEDGHDIIDIIALATEPARLRKGIMARLLSAFVEFFSKKKSTIFLEVHVDNFAALPLYEALGFKVSHIRKCYYADQRDGLIMHYTRD